MTPLYHSAPKKNLFALMPTLHILTYVLANVYGDLRETNLLQQGFIQLK